MNRRGHSLQLVDAHEFSAWYLGRLSDSSKFIIVGVSERPKKGH